MKEYISSLDEGIIEAIDALVKFGKEAVNVGWNDCKEEEERLISDYADTCRDFLEILSKIFKNKME